MKYRLYPWQEDCLGKWEREGFRGIANVVTGGGKTILALAAAQRLEKALQGEAAVSGEAGLQGEAAGSGEAGLRVKIVVPSTALLSQWAGAILDFFEGVVGREDIGYCYNGQTSGAGRKFALYVANTARYTLARKVLEDFKEGCTVFLIADECHHYGAPENRKMFEFLPYCKNYPGQYASIGLSATPGKGSRGYEAVLVPALGQEICHYGFPEAVSQQTLTSYAIFEIGLSFSEKEWVEYGDIDERIKRAWKQLVYACPALRDYTSDAFFVKVQALMKEGGREGELAKQFNRLVLSRKRLVADAENRVGCAVELIGLLDRNSRILVFGERLIQADRLYEELAWRFPNQVARSHSGMEAAPRQAALERYRNGEVRILVSCRAIDEGLDVPAADVGIVLSSAGVERQRIQRLGRILRRSRGKEIASLYYLYVEETVEKEEYLPVREESASGRWQAGGGEIQRKPWTCRLAYDAAGRRFAHPGYDGVAGAVLEEFREKDADLAHLAAAKECLRQGAVRPDWLLGAAYCAGKREGAQAMAERNYWLCMEKVAGIAASLGNCPQPGQEGIK